MTNATPDTISQLLAAVKQQLDKMSNPQHPAYRIVIERTSFGYDQNHVPQVAEFVLRVEYVSAVAQLPVQGVSGLVLPPNMRGVPTPNADIEQADTHNPTQT